MSYELLAPQLFDYVNFKQKNNHVYFHSCTYLNAFQCCYCLFTNLLNSSKINSSFLHFLNFSIPQSTGSVNFLSIMYCAT